MRRLLTSIAIPIVLGWTASVLIAGTEGVDAYGEKAATLAGPPLDESTVISLQRGPCFGRCSEYTVTVFGSGRVEFEGRRHVCAPGRRTAWASPDEVRTLVAQMLAFGYLELEWRRGSLPTNSPTVISSLSYGGRTHRVAHHVGDPGAPRLLSFLEDDIDTVAGSWRWLPEREDNRRVCRTEDGETELLETFIPTR